MKTSIPTIKALELRLGNFAIAADEHEYDFVIALEPGLVHLSRRTDADDERNVYGLPLSENTLRQLGFLKNSIGIWRHVLYAIILCPSTLPNTYTINSPENNFSFYRPFSFAHELQNAAYSLIGKEIFEEDTFNETQH